MFDPTKSVRRVTDINVEMLDAMGVNGIIVDVDETLAEQNSQKLFGGVKLWLEYMRKNDRKIIIVSNNFKNRVEPLATALGIPYITAGLKPFPIGLIRAAMKIKCKIREVVVVGDQIFTDILGANLCGMKSILVEPVSVSSKMSMRLKRRLERPIRKKMKFMDSKDSKYRK